MLLDLEQLFPTAAESTLSAAVRRLQESSTTAGIGACRGRLVRVLVLGRARHRVLPDLPPAVPGLGATELFALGMFAWSCCSSSRASRCRAQGLLVTGADDLPLGLSDVHGLIYGVTLAAAW